MNIQKEIQEAINKQLPAEVGNTLKERLEKAEENEKELEAVLKELKEVHIENKRLHGLTKKLTKDAEDVEKQKSLNAKNNEDLCKREIELDKTIAELKLENAEKTTEEVKDLVRLVFRSPVYRKEINSNTYDGQASTNSNSTERVVEEN